MKYHGSWLIKYGIMCRQTGQVLKKMALKVIKYTTNKYIYAIMFYFKALIKNKVAQVFDIYTKIKKTTYSI